MTVYHVCVNCWTRWLTHDSSNQSVRQRYSQLLTILRKVATGEAIEGVDDSELPPGVALGEASVSCTGLYHIMNCGEFPFFTCVLCDYLPIMAGLSKLFQTDDADFSLVVDETKVAAAAIRAMIATPGENTAGYEALVKECIDAGHFKVGKPGHPSRTKEWRERQRVLLLTSIALGLEEDMKEAPLLAAMQAVLHIEKYPPSMKDPDVPPSVATMTTYFGPHVKILEEHFGAGRKFADGAVTDELLACQATLVARLARGRIQHLVDETERRRTAAKKATVRARTSRSNAPAVVPVPVAAMPLKECVRILVVSPVGRTVITHLAHVAECTAAGAACVERGVSREAQVKTSLSTNMRQDLLDGLMQLGENSPFPFGDPRWDDFYVAALHLFVRKTNRRVCLDLPTSKLLERPDPPGWSEDYEFGKTFTDEAGWKAEVKRVRDIELANRRKFLVVSAAMSTGHLELVTGERVPYIADPGPLMTVSEGDRILHWWKDCGDKDRSSGYLESSVARKCGRTSEWRWWNLYQCDKKEAKHDLKPDNHGVDVSAGQCWVWAAAERLAVDGAAAPGAAAAAVAAERTLDFARNGGRK